MRDEEQQRKERQAKLLSAIERKIAYKNIDFIIQHQKTASTFEKAALNHPQKRFPFARKSGDAKKVCFFEK